jgi:hypothetical protein
MTKTGSVDYSSNLAQALDDAGEPRRSVDVELTEALTLAKATGNDQYAARACVQAL